MATARKPLGDDDVTVKDAQALPAPEPRQADIETNPGPDELDEETTASFGEEEADEEVPAPPEADAVALRALAIAGLLRRLELERRNAPLKEIEALQSWVEEHGLFASFGPVAFELFDAPPGEWTDDDAQSVAWAAEELHVLCWALGLADTPPLFARATGDALLAALPMEGAPEPFAGAATVREHEELELARALHETLHESARTEAWARGVADDASLAANDEELDQVLEVVEQEGFERARVVAEQGAQAAAVQGLRAWSRLLLAQLFEPGSPHAALAFAPEKLEGLDDEALANVLAAAQLRAETLAWLTEGEVAEED